MRRDLREEDKEDKRALSQERGRAAPNGWEYRVLGPQEPWKQVQDYPKGN